MVGFQIEGHVTQMTLSILIRKKFKFAQCCKNKINLNFTHQLVFFFCVFRYRGTTPKGFLND
jgi:hypothetical protein